VGIGNPTRLAVNTRRPPALDPHSRWRVCVHLLDDAQYYCGGPACVCDTRCFTMTKSGLPKGPRSALSQLFAGSDPYPLMLDLMRKHEDPMLLPMIGRDPMVITWGPEGAKAVFSADPDTFEPGAVEALEVIVGKGSIFVQSGAAHRRSRKLLAPPFQGERMRAYGKIIRDATIRWREKMPETAAPVLSTAQGITLDVIVEAIFGEQDSARVAQLHDEILAVVAAFNPVIATFRFFQKDWFGPWKRFKDRATQARGTMQALVDRKKQTSGDDILSLLVAARDAQGQPLGDDEILEQLMTFVVAGHETTATTLAWALYELHRNPETLTKLRGKLDDLGPDPSPDLLSKVPYLQAVCDETLRLHPPLPMVSRKLTRDFELCGYMLPRGISIGVASYMAHHREEVFERPTRFEPERFVDKKYSPFEYYPWGGGARRCLGAAFAAYELQISLATLLLHGQYVLEEPRAVKHEFRVGVYGPEGGIKLRPVVRG